MLPGTTRPINLPPGYQPPESGYIEINLATHFRLILEKKGGLENLSAQRVRELNHHLKLLQPTKIWNACNGCHIGLGAELSLDATPISFHFINNIIPKPPARRRSVSIKRYFEEKYQIRLNYPNSPLLRDVTGSMFPLEAVWIRFNV